MVCRSPIYDIDHIVDYAAVREHTFENLALLCTVCHRKKIRGLITLDRIRRARELVDRTGRTAPDYIHAEFRGADLGGNFIRTIRGNLFDIQGFGYAAIRYDERPLLAARIFEQMVLQR